MKPAEALQKSIGFKPQIILVTGFLGSGKTTLLNRLIQQYRSKKLAIIVNDFGQIAVDGILIKDAIDDSVQSDTDVYEIANGSIFCSCLSAELVKALKQVVIIQPDILLIETSGLSDPSTFNTILEENNLAAQFEVISSICIVDPTRTMQLARQIVSIERQISSSRLIVVNKVDLITKDEYATTVRFIQELNDSAEIIKSINADFDLSLIGQKSQSQRAATPPESCNTVHSRPGSILLEQREISRDDLIAFYHAVQDKLFRIKGFLEIEGSPYYISDNNEMLQIEDIQQKSYRLGLSVLAPTLNTQLIENTWLNIEY